MKHFLYVYSVRMLTFDVFLGYYIPNALRKICNCFWIGSTSTKIGHFTACLYSLFAQKYNAMKRKHFYSLFSPISISTNIHIQHFIVCRFFYGCQSLVFVCHFHSCGWLWLTYINGCVVHSHKINDIRIMTNIFLNELSGGDNIDL